MLQFGLGGRVTFLIKPIPASDLKLDFPYVYIFGVSGKSEKSAKKSRECVLPNNYKEKSGNSNDHGDDQEDIREIACLGIFSFHDKDKANFFPSIG